MALSVQPLSQLPFQSSSLTSGSSTGVHAEIRICCFRGEQRTRSLTVTQCFPRSLPGNQFEPLGDSLTKLRTLGSRSESFPSGKCRLQGQRSLLPRAKASSTESAESEGGGMTVLGIPLSGSQVKIAAAAALTIFLGVANRVLYKMALVPLNNYPFFLAQLTTFGYVLVYFFILSLRYQAGVISPPMLKLPKGPFALMGALEAMGLASGMAAAAFLPGAVISILTQVYLVWQLILSVVVLKKRYSSLQVTGVLMVLAGVVIVVSSGGGAGSALAGAGFWPLLMMFSTVFSAGASILKELVFTRSKDYLEGKTVDLFVVNSFGSGFQAFFVFLLLPLLSSLKGIPPAELPSYFSSGAACLLNFGKVGTGCEGAPLIPILYVAVNLAFNISALNLLRISSAVISSLAITFCVPLTVYAFTFPLPLLGHPDPLPPGFSLGCSVLVAGLGLYNVSGAMAKKASPEKSQ
eukprot:TRINITY_DN913_c0_g1_i1.p1 TRINITY_DN913_c0_g1~~TRINITY_DN913_c0_g1_i1.p1  ORF type:complete len:464 (-),score=70.97 TRINITY_DN913_c0_g1_i1:881-2272(-)